MSIYGSVGEMLGHCSIYNTDQLKNYLDAIYCRHFIPVGRHAEGFKISVRRSGVACVKFPNPAFEVKGRSVKNKASQVSNAIHFNINGQTDGEAFTKVLIELQR